jgi:hypothetical protein
MKKGIWIVSIVIVLLISIFYKSIREGFEDATNASFGILPINGVVGSNALKIADEVLPKFAICIQKATNEKSQCKKGLTCQGNPNQYGNCL